MKYIVLLLIPIFISCTNNSVDNDLTGEWQDVNGEAFDHCTANFEQDGNTIYFNHFLTWNGQPFFEKGSGVVRGDSIIYHVDVLYGIEGWSTAGDHFLKISPDGNRLTGSYIDNKGNTGPLEFTRVRE